MDAIEVPAGEALLEPEPEPAAVPFCAVVLRVELARELVAAGPSAVRLNDSTEELRTERDDLDVLSELEPVPEGDEAVPDGVAGSVTADSVSIIVGPSSMVLVGPKSVLADPVSVLVNSVSVLVTSDSVSVYSDPVGTESVVVMKYVNVSVTVIG